MAKSSGGNITLTDKTYKFNFVGKGKIFYFVSLAIILTGLIFFFIRGFNFGIDFVDGNLMEVKFKQDVSIKEVRKVMEEAGFGNSIIQNTAADQYIIRTAHTTEEEKTKILNDLDSKIGINKPLVQDREVKKGFSNQVTKYALIAVAISLAGILIYVWIRFEVRFALAAIFELIHDLLIILSIYLITYREFNVTTIAVILTVLGYSVNDAIIIFDRVREELRINKRDRLFDVVNYSINKIFVRSISTVITTLLPILVLLILGNAILKDFAFGLFVGIISGTYSSIFIGSPLVVSWNNRFPKYKK